MDAQVPKERPRLLHDVGLAHLQGPSRVRGRVRAHGHALRPDVARGHIPDQRLLDDAVQCRAIFQGVTPVREVAHPTDAGASVVPLTEGDAAEAVAMDVVVGAQGPVQGLGQDLAAVTRVAGKGESVLVSAESWARPSSRSPGTEFN